jgi:hypothetical protein
LTIQERDSRSQETPLSGPIIESYAGKPARDRPPEVTDPLPNFAVDLPRIPAILRRKLARDRPVTVSQESSNSSMISRQLHAEAGA